MPEEKVFTIPLREAFEKQRRFRAKNATNIIRNFLKKHMKTESIKIGESINKSVWGKGIQNPPRKLRIHVVKEENIVYAELLGTEIKTPSAEEIKKKKEKEKEKKEKIKEERKERRKMTIQEEIEEEVKGKPKEVEKVEEKKEEKPSEKQEVSKEEPKTEPKEEKSEQQA